MGECRARRFVTVGKNLLRMGLNRQCRDRVGDVKDGFPGTMGNIRGLPEVYRRLILRRWRLSPLWAGTIRGFGRGLRKSVNASSSSASSQPSVDGSPAGGGGVCSSAFNVAVKSGGRRTTLLLLLFFSQQGAE